jgi:hypothetical protein
MDLFLRKVIHPQAIDNYRILKDDGTEIEIGSGSARHASGPPGQRACPQC